MLASLDSVFLPQQLPLPRKRGGEPGEPSRLAGENGSGQWRVTYRSRLESPAKALGPMEEILLWLM